MQAKRLNASSTTARYQIDMAPEDMQAGLATLIDRLEPMNYGFRIVSRPSESSTVVDINID